MSKTRVLYAEEILNQLYVVRGRDSTVDIREIYLQMDSWVNQNAKAGYLINMKLGQGQGIDDQFVTTFEWLTVTDPSGGAPSNVQIPANYADLPKNQGIQQVYFKNDITLPKKKYFDPVIIRSSAAVSEYRGNMASGLEGRLSVSVRGGYLYFNTGNINTKYGQIGMRLVVRDSSQISDSAPYPVPADLEWQMKEDVVNYFLKRRGTPVDLIKDGNDKP